MDSFGEFVEFATVFQRQTHQFGDHERRHLTGDVADEIALARRDHGIHDLRCQLLDPLSSQTGCRLGELRADQFAERGVLRRVHHQHHLVAAQPELGERIGDHDGGL